MHTSDLHKLALALQLQFLYSQNVLWFTQHWVFDTNAVVAHRLADATTLQHRAYRRSHR